MCSTFTNKGLFIVFKYLVLIFSHPQLQEILSRISGTKDICLSSHVSKIFLFPCTTVFFISSGHVRNVFQPLETHIVYVLLGMFFQRKALDILFHVCVPWNGFIVWYCIEIQKS